MDQRIENIGSENMREIKKSKGEQFRMIVQNFETWKSLPEQK